MLVNVATTKPPLSLADAAARVISFDSALQENGGGDGGGEDDFTRGAGRYALFVVREVVTTAALATAMIVRSPAATKSDAMTNSAVRAIFARRLETGGRRSQELLQGIVVKRTEQKKFDAPTPRHLAREGEME